MEHFGLVISCCIGTVFDFVSEDRMNVSYVDVVFILRLYLNFSRNYNGNFGYNLIGPTEAVVQCVFGLRGGIRGGIVGMFGAHSIICGNKEALEGADGVVGPCIEYWWDWFSEGYG